MMRQKKEDNALKNSLQKSDWVNIIKNTRKKQEIKSINRKRLFKNRLIRKISRLRIKLKD